jgi:hypothetical protein
VSVCVSRGWVLRYCARVKVLIFYPFLTWIRLCFWYSLCMCVGVFLCHGVHREMNRHSREISEIVPAHTRAHTHMQRSLTRLSCGGDECDAESLSLFIHIYKNRHTSMHVCLFVLLSIQTAGCLTLIRSRSSYNHTYQHAYLCVCVYLIFFCLFCWVCLRAGGLTLCFSSIQVYYLSH